MSHDSTAKLWGHGIRNTIILLMANLHQDFKWLWGALFAQPSIHEFERDLALLIERKVKRFVPVGALRPTGRRSYVLEMDRSGRGTPRPGIWEVTFRRRALAPLPCNSIQNESELNLTHISI